MNETEVATILDKLYRIEDRMAAICYKHFDGEDCTNCPLKTGTYDDCEILILSIDRYYPGYLPEYIAKVKRGEAEWE